ncbi:MAG: MBL fold metallo-hydrolase [Anaerolineales bacterium]|nr:MBL fold metallo-hydrolase [Anaerolineales bacterium]
MSSSGRVTWLGHATLLIEMEGMRILTDPLLRDRILHLKRCSASIPPIAYSNLSAVLISHMHYDHLDPPSLRKLECDTRFIVPRGSAGLIRRQGFKRVEEVVEGETLRVGEVEVEAFRADHHGRRLGISHRADSIGFVLRGQAQVYFAGDTDLFPEMEELSGHLDIGLVPIWGWGPNLGKGHMDPLKAAQALTYLRPRIAVPIHWGTFYPFGINWLKPALSVELPRRFATFTRRMTPEVRVKILRPMEELTI